MDLSSRGVLHVHRPGGAGSPLCPGLPPRDPGPAAGGHWEPVLRSAVLLWSLLAQWQPPRPLHPGKRQQLPLLWQRCLRCRVDWEGFLSALCPLVCWCERNHGDRTWAQTCSSWLSKLSLRQSPLGVGLFFFLFWCVLLFSHHSLCLCNCGAIFSSINMNRVLWNSFAGTIIIPANELLCNNCEAETDNDSLWWALGKGF